MKKVVSENTIRNIIAESIKKHLKESFFGNEYNEFEDDGRLSDMNQEDSDDKEVRDSIESFFKRPGVNNAPYAYSLYGVEPEEGKDTNEMKNARKKFADCINHTKNENGYPYSFDSAELNRLKNMISSNQLSEAIRKSIKKVLSETKTTKRFKR